MLVKAATADKQPTWLTGRWPWLSDFSKIYLVYDHIVFQDQARRSQVTRTSWMDRFRTPLKQWDLFDALPRSRSLALLRGVVSSRVIYHHFTNMPSIFLLCGHTPCAQVMHCIRAHTKMNRIRRETLLIEVASDCWEIHASLLSPNTPGISSNQTCTWWSHQMETFSALLAFCAGVIQWWPVNSPHKGQWSGALVFSFIWGWRNS